MDGETRFTLNGRAVSRKEFLRRKRGFSSGSPMVAPPGNWPMRSNAMGVAPEQIDEAMAYDRKLTAETGKNIHCEFDRKTGEAIFHTKEQYRNYARAHKFYCKNAGYSDPVKE